MGLLGRQRIWGGKASGTCGLRGLWSPDSSAEYKSDVRCDAGCLCNAPRLSFALYTDNGVIWDRWEIETEERMERDVANQCVDPAEERQEREFSLAAGM